MPGTELQEIKCLSYQFGLKGKKCLLLLLLLLLLLFCIGMEK